MSQEPETDDGSQAETLRMLRDAAAGFAKFDGPRIRSLRSTPGRIDRAKWTAMAEQGWLSIMVPEAVGGLDLGLGAATAIAERLGLGCMPEPFVAAGVMAPYVLGQCTDAALKARVLPKVMAGECLVTLAWQNDVGSLSIDDVQATASESNRQATLNGTSRFIAAPGADAFLVVTRRPDGQAIYWVDRSTPGLQLRLEPLADGSASGWLYFARAQVPATNLIAGPAQTEALVRSALDLGLIAQSAELVGNMERALEMTLDYLRTRKQFGQAIGGFQALQHRAVDLWMHKELARHALAAAARTVASSTVTAATRAAAASSAKHRAAESGLLMAKQTIQLHGAIGTTDEYDLGLYVNRCVALVPWLGNAAEHRQRYGAMAPARERISTGA